MSFCVHVRLCVGVRECVCLCVCLCVYVCVPPCVCVCIFVCAYLCVCLFPYRIWVWVKCECLCICVYVCVSMCVYEVHIELFSDFNVYFHHKHLQYALKCVLAVLSMCSETEVFHLSLTLNPWLCEGYLLQSFKVHFRIQPLPLIRKVKPW